MNSKIVRRVIKSFIIILFLYGCSEVLPNEVQKTSGFFQEIDSLNELSFRMLHRDLDRSIQLSHRADSLSRLYAYPNGLARSLRSRAYGAFYQDNSSLALEFLKESEDIESEDQNVKGLVAVKNIRAFIFKKNGLYYEAKKLYQNSIHSKDSAITERSRILAYNNIANVYTQLVKYDSAVYYYNKLFIDFPEIKNDSNLIATVLSNTANAQSLMKNYDEAKTNYFAALSYCKKSNIRQKAKIFNNLGALFFELENYKMATDYYQKSLKIKQEYFDGTSILANGYQNISNIYKETGYPLKASSFLRKAQVIFEKNNNIEDVAKIHLSRANLLISGGNYTQAKLSLNEANDLIKRTKRPDLKKQSIKLLSQVLDAQGRHKESLEKYKEYERLSDSLLNADTFWKVAEIEKKHQLQIKQKELELVEKDRDLSEAEVLQKTSENERLYGTVGFIGILSFLLIILVFYLNKLRKVSLLNSQQQEALLHERIQNLTNDQKIKIMNATMEGRTKEKKIISKELHDNVGSLLTAINFHLNAFNQSVFQSSPKMKQLHTKLLGITENVIDEVRHISHRLDHESSLSFNLEASIEDFCKKVENDQLRIETSVKDLENFQNPEISIFIFRVLQELVNNVIKHAEASLVNLSLKNQNNSIQIQLRDNGKGFVTNVSEGIGLKNLKRQIKEMKGQFLLETFANQGTEVSINIPV